MTSRAEVRHEIEIDLIEYLDSPYAERVKRVGVELETDAVLLHHAATALREVNLSRYPKDEELKEAIRAARVATSEAYQLLLDRAWKG